MVTEGFVAEGEKGDFQSLQVRLGGDLRMAPMLAAAGQLAAKERKEHRGFLLSSLCSPVANAVAAASRSPWQNCRAWRSERAAADVSRL